MSPIWLLACLLILADLIKSDGVVAPSGGGISKQHRQQDDYGNYNFGYEVQDPTSHHFRRESGDVYGRIVGSYGLSEADGRQRIVDYVADEYGFRAKVRTNEPGTGAENSAAVEVVKPGHPPGPPRIPAISSPPHPPSQRSSGLAPPHLKSSFASRIPLSGQEFPPPYIQHPLPYGHPYYYSPVKSSFGNSIHSQEQIRPSLYIPRPQLQDNYDRYDKYKPQVSIQSYYPVPPPSAAIPQKYIYAPPISQPQIDLNLPSDSTQNKIGYNNVKLPANYKVVRIPNGIQAVPISAPSSTGTVRGIDRIPYQYFDTNPPRNSYPSGPNPIYLGFKGAQKSAYADSPRDYKYSGSDQIETVVTPDKESAQR